MLKNRYRPKFDWNDTLWTYNLFRVFEYIFGRKVGVKPEIVQPLGFENNIIIFYTWEAFLVHSEVRFRDWLKGLEKDFFAFKIYFPQMALPYGMRVSSPYLFAIAYDLNMQGALATIGPGTTVTNSITVTGSNTAIMTGWSGNNSADENCTGVTYASAALTKAEYIAQDGGGTPFDRATYLYYKLGCATGANDLVHSYTNSHFVFGFAGSYSGVDSAGEVVHNQGQATAASITVSVTTTAENTWLAGYGNSNANNVSAGTSTTARALTDGSATYNWWDSNGARASGSNSLIISHSSGSLRLVLMSFAPVVTASSTSPLSNLLLMDV